MANAINSITHASPRTMHHAPLTTHHYNTFMFNWFLRNVLGKIAAVSVRRRLAAFEEATRHAQEIQDALLGRILARQASTAFGKDHFFSTMRTLSDFRKIIPVRDYDYIE